jgi:1,4-dihydroxy-2-naphthoate octaprenyltransferase
MNANTAVMTFRQFLRVVNIRVQVVTLSPICLGILLATASGNRLVGIPSILFALSAALIGMGTTALNSYADFMRGIDNKDFSLEAEKALVHEGVPPGAVLVVAVALFASGSALGLGLCLLIDWWIALVGILGLSVAIFYSAGPFPISRTPLGEVFVGASQGSLLFCVAYLVQGATLDRTVVLLSLPSAVFVALILSVNNSCDRIGDRAGGRRTLSILLGPVGSRVLVPCMGYSGYALALMAVGKLGNGRSTALLCLALGALVCAPLFLKMDKRGYSHATKPANMQAVLSVFLVFTLAMGAAIVVSFA